MTDTITKPFVDQSIFQGITQYFDDNGVEWRRNDFMESTKWYRLEGDSFVFQGTISGNFEGTSIYKAHMIFLAHNLED